MSAIREMFNEAIAPEALAMIEAVDRWSEHDYTSMARLAAAWNDAGRPLVTGIALPSIGPHEDAIIRRIHARLAAGHEQYGPLEPHDGRDWSAEAAEELLDWLVYREIGRMG